MENYSENSSPSSPKKTEGLQRLKNMAAARLNKSPTAAGSPGSAQPDLIVSHPIGASPKKGSRPGSAAQDTSTRASAIPRTVLPQRSRIPTMADSLPPASRTSSSSSSSIPTTTRLPTSESSSASRIGRGPTSSSNISISTASTITASNRGLSRASSTAGETAGQRSSISGSAARSAAPAAAAGSRAAATNRTHATSGAATAASRPVRTSSTGNSAPSAAAASGRAGTLLGSRQARTSANGSARDVPPVAENPAAAMPASRRAPPSPATASRPSASMVAAKPASREAAARPQERPKPTTPPLAKPKQRWTPPVPADEDIVVEAVDIGPLMECPSCGRNFSETAYPKHVKVCQKVFVQKRKVFDSTQARLSGTEAAQFTDGKKPGAGGRQAAAKAAKPAARARPSAQDDRPIPKTADNSKPSWKVRSEQFRAAMQASRMIKEAQERGEDIRNLVLPTGPEAADDRVPCPHCGRKFAALTAERHIPKCKDTMAKPSMLKAGAGKGAHMRSGAAPGRR